MTRQADPTTIELLAGAVERVTFHNAESGFCVLRVKARGHRDLVTIVGHAASISAGEWLTASGEWTNDRTHVGARSLNIELQAALNPVLADHLEIDGGEAGRRQVEPGGLDGEAEAAVGRGRCAVGHRRRRDRARGRGWEADWRARQPCLGRPARGRARRGRRERGAGHARRRRLCG